VLRRQLLHLHLKPHLKTFKTNEQTTKDADVNVKPTSLIRNAVDYNFLLCLEMMPNILNIIVVTSQSQYLDLLVAMDNVKALRTAPQNLRDGGDIHEIHSRTLQICEELDVDIPVVKRRQPHRINEHPETKE